MEGFPRDGFFHSSFPEFILSQKLHINALELLTVMVTVKLWGHNWKGKKIIINCDNMASVRVLNVGFSRDLFSCENRIPDYLSRWDTDPKFRTLFYGSVSGFRLQ